MKKSIFTLVLFLITSLWSIVYGPAFAQSSPVPHLINFQTILTDVAGVPLPDGFYEVGFRIVDPNGEVRYQETQKLETVGGVASAMVGAQGELDLAIFDPEKPKFLEVEVLGNGPARTMEIVTVPYSLFAEQALNVAPQSIGAEAIRPGTLTRELLAEDLLEELLGDPSLAESSGANQIGVETNFLYSRGPTVQTVLKDLDTAIHQRQINMERKGVDLNARIDTEASSRQSEDTRLQSTIDAEVAARQLARTELQTSINTETTTRQSTDTQLQTNIDQERNDRTAAVTNLQGQINSVNTSVSTNQNETESRLGTLEQNVDTLMNPPHVQAAGIVSVAGGSANLSWGYNISNVSLESSARVDIHFSSSITTPYVVVVTPLADGGASSTNPVHIESIAADSFQARTNLGGAIPGFHFVVVK